MTRPNYNLIRFIRRCISQMKKEYGSPATIYKLVSAATDLGTGVKTVSKKSVYVPRIVVLPNKLTREAIQSISAISANKKVVQGATFDPGTRTFIIDRRDAPGWELRQDDWIVYNSKRYDMKSIEEFEQGTAWLVVAREVESVKPEEDHNVVANNYLLDLQSEAAYTLMKRLLQTVTDNFGVSDVATHLLTPNSWLGGTVSSSLLLSDSTSGYVGSLVTACPSLDYTHVESANWSGFQTYISSNKSQSGTDILTEKATFSDSYFSAVMASDSITLVMPPAAGNQVETYNTANNTVSSFGSIPGTSYKYLSCSLGHDGKVYCAPYQAAEILIIDTTNQTTAFGPTITVNSFFNGTVTAPNGKIYFIPYRTANVGVYNPTSNTYTTIATGLSAGKYLFMGGSLAPNGKIYCAPHSHNKIMVIDPDTDSVSFLATDYTFDAYKWTRGCVADNGMLYFAPYTYQSSILKIDPTSNTSSTFGSVTNFQNYKDLTLAPNGFLYAVGKDGIGILKVDPSTDTLTTFANTLLNWTTPTMRLSLDGNFYAIGGGSNKHVIKLEPDSTTMFCEEVVRASYWNKG